MRRARKRKNSSSARHYDQISFYFRTAKTQSCLNRFDGISAPAGSASHVLAHAVSAARPEARCRADSQPVAAQRSPMAERSVPVHSRKAVVESAGGTLSPVHVPEDYQCQRLLDINGVINIAQTPPARGSSLCPPGAQSLPTPGPTPAAITAAGVTIARPQRC
jgi:hypothetical protein